ncbi:hypothetical protein Tco_0139503 [Tanacetum coccineum]
MLANADGYCGSEINLTTCYKLRKALYGLKQAPRAVDYEISQSPRASFINQSKYAHEIAKKYGFESVTQWIHTHGEKSKLDEMKKVKVGVSITTNVLGLPKKHLNEVKRNLSVSKMKRHRDFGIQKILPRTKQHLQMRIMMVVKIHAVVDYAVARCYENKKSTTGVEYVAAANRCGQVLWIQNQLLDYGYNFMNTKIFIDNESTICIVKNLVFHSKTKNIEKDITSISISEWQVIRSLTRSAKSGKTEWKGLSLVTYETVIKEWEDRMERAVTTAFSLEAELWSQFWATAKAKTVNKEHQIQALVDKKKVIINEKSVRSDLMLEDVEGTECLLNDVIFK